MWLKFPLNRLIFPRICPLNPSKFDFFPLDLTEALSCIPRQLLLPPILPPPPGPLGGAMLIVTGYGCPTVNLILAPVLSQS